MAVLVLVAVLMPPLLRPGVRSLHGNGGIGARLMALRRSPCCFTCDEYEYRRVACIFVLGWP